MMRFRLAHLLLLFPVAFACLFAWDAGRRYERWLAAQKKAAAITVGNVVSVPAIYTWTIPGDSVAVEQAPSGMVSGIQAVNIVDFGATDDTAAIEGALNAAAQDAD